MSHKHDIQKTKVSFVEFDDVSLSKLAKDKTYFGEGNSKERIAEYDFEYCLSCGLRLVDEKRIMTKDILEEEFERFVIKTKKGSHISSERTTLQHSDFEAIQRLIKSALEFGKLKGSLFG